MLEVRSIESYYGDSQILRGINLALPGGARVAVLGRNGSGKTTFLKSIMNAGPRVVGGMTWQGRPLHGLAPHLRARAGLSFVPEDRRIFNHLTVLENLKLARDSAGAEGPFPLPLVLSWFPMLVELQSRYGNQLSGGQQQMLAVARGMVPRPKLVLLDEPTEGLAPIIVQQLAASVTQICTRENIGLLLSEQNIWFARRCTEHLHVIDNGRFVFSGSWDEFDADAGIKNRYLAV